MRAVDFSPLYRSTVGFDRLFSALDQFVSADSVPSYPPYNIERTGENAYRITVAVAGFTTTAHPAAIAGAILRVAIASGKFHGVMSTERPTGARRTRMLAPPPGASRNPPAVRTASSAYQRTKSVP